MVPKLLLLFTADGWSAQPYSVNFALQSSVLGELNGSSDFSDATFCSYFMLSQRLLGLNPPFPRIEMQTYFIATFSEKSILEKCPS